MSIANTDTRRIISEVLDIDNNAAWDIVSSDPDHHLYTVHHKPEADLGKYGQIRGVVVDTLAKTIVCRSYGYTPIVTSDQITVQEGDNKIHLIDNLGTEHVLDPARIHMKTGFEGTLMYAFKHDGKVYRSTRKRLDPSRSRWGNSRPFTEMYWELGGPSDEVLFNPNSRYSPYCHVFIIVHPEVLVVSKDNVGAGYLVYLGPKQMWSVDPDESPYKQVSEEGNLMFGVSQEDFDEDPRPNAGWIDDTLYVPETLSNMNDNVTRDYAIFSPPNLSFDGANKHLLFGFYDPINYSIDKRLLPGEFVIINQLDDNGAVVKMIRVESTSYSWRSGMRDNNPNLLHQFFKTINGSYINNDTVDGKRRYDTLYPSLTPYSSDSINEFLKGGPIIIWPQNPNIDIVLKTKDEKLYNIWLAFINAVPLHSQKAVSGYLDYLYNNRDELIGWLRSMENRGHLDSTELSSRAIDIIRSARRFSRDSAAKGKDVNRSGKRISMKQMVRNNIRNLVMKERGPSLYKLIKEMNRWKRDKAEAEQTDNK